MVVFVLYVIAPQYATVFFAIEQYSHNACRQSNSLIVRALAQNLARLAGVKIVINIIFRNDHLIICQKIPIKN